MDFHIFNILKVKQKPRLSKMCIICGFLCVLYLLTNTIVVFELAHYDRSGSSASDAIVNQSFIIKTVEEYVAGTFVGHLQKIPEHHTEMETHRYQISLSSKRLKELHQLMSKQYDVKHGLYEGKHYKKILYWNPAYHGPPTADRKDTNYGVGVGRDQYKLAGCPVWQCETSENRSNLTSYDAVLVHQRFWNSTDLPNERSPHQLYIFYSIESPAWPVPDENNAFDHMAGFFNWTMTYRWDSDVIHPYGWIEPVNINSVPMHPSEEVYKQLLESFNRDKKRNYAAGKEKLVVAMTSNCATKSNREEMVINMAKTGIQVDTYGSCGNNLKCGTPKIFSRPQSVEEDCFRKAAKEYKFFLAFHNSLCLDYYNERFFNAMSHPIIPIVIDAHGHHARASPPHSFINALDFPSVKDLADYLMILDSNDTLYNEYFWWKNHYRIKNGNLYEGVHFKTWCSLCAALHNPSLHSNRKLEHQSYGSMRDWWKDKSDCKTLLHDGLYTANQSIIDAVVNELIYGK